MITPKELPTVIAALHHWQDLEKQFPAVKFEPADDRTRTYFEEHDILTVEEIDALCERLNCSVQIGKEAMSKERTAVINRTLREVAMFVGDEQGGHIEFAGKVWRPVD